MHFGSSLVQARRWRVLGLPALAIALMLLLLAGLIYAGTMQLRQKVRGQITRRDGEILKAVALMQQLSGESDAELGGEIEFFADQFNIALQVSQLNRGILGTRLYDAKGNFLTAFPATVQAAPLPAADLPGLARLQSVSRFAPNLPLSDVIGDTVPSAERAPILEVEIPLYRMGEERLQGIVQFIIDGADVAGEFAALDRHLAWQAGIAFLAGALLTVATLGWAFRRLDRSARLLRERTHRLQEANEQLVLAAKTSAVGAVTAHLVHGLSSPLAGLKDWISGLEAGAETDTLVQSTRRMEGMVRDLVSFLGEERSEHYEVRVRELLGTLQARLRAEAQASGVCLKMSHQVEGILDNRQANLIVLILHQLLENALQATPPGRSVSLRVLDQPGSGARFVVEDQGAGFPEHLRQRLFSPCRSTKAHGHGVGLSIAKQLANHLGASLELRPGGPGCAFELTLPCLISKTPLAPQTVSG